MSTFKLRCSDALTAMAALPESCISAVVCDPPYGTTRNAWDAVIPLPEMWAALARVVRPGGAIVLLSAQPFTSALVMSNLQQYRHEWVWHKNKATGHLNARRAPMRAHENVLVFCDVAPVYNPQCTVGHAPMNAHYTGHNGSNYGSGRQVTGGGSTARYPRSVQEFPIVNNDDPAKVHPTQKPVALMEYLVRTYTNPEDIVLDFAMGSGTTGEACLRSGRQFVGIDSDRTMVAHAQKRLQLTRNCGTITTSATK